MLICPSFFDDRFDGIGRVSGAFFDAMAGKMGNAPYLLSANDPASAVARDKGRAYDRSYARMIIEAAMGTKLEEHARKDRGFPPIVCTHLGLSPVARVLGSRVRRPYVVFLHGIECWKPLRLRAKWGICGAAKLLFNSNYTQRTFLRFNPWAAKVPCEVVQLGVPVPELEDTCARAKDPSTDFTILCVGRMSKAEYYEGFRDGTDLYKGFKQLIMAVGIVGSSHPGVRLEIVGDGDARPDLEAWLATRDERRLVRMRGRVSDTTLHDLYGRSDVFALPSEGEGFGLVFAEAMAHGLPCVCVDAGAAPEVVVHDVTGLVARPRDVEDLADKISLVAKDAQLRIRLGASAKRRFEEFYTTAKFHARIVRALEC